MKKQVFVLSLSLSLTAPFALTQIAAAQVTPSAVVCQRGPGMESYRYSGYSYYDALVLANFWGTSLDKAKGKIGTKSAAGPDSKAFLSLTLTEARNRALQNANFLKLFIDSGYSYKDAEDLARFWGESNVREAKLRIERNLALGNHQGISHVLKLARKAR